MRRHLVHSAVQKMGPPHSGLLELPEGTEAKNTLLHQTLRGAGTFIANVHSCPKVRNSVP